MIWIMLESIELPGGLFGLYNVCVSEIMKILDYFYTNKAAGFDGLSGIFIKLCLNQSPIL